MKITRKKQLKKSGQAQISNQNIKKKKKKHFVKKSDDFSKSQMDEVRKKQLLEANKEEDKTIKRLEKLLKIDKKKKKKPSSFLGDGLDYLLEVIDNKDSNMLLSDDSMESEEEFSTAIKKENPSVLARRKAKEESVESPPKKRTLTDLLKEKEGHVSEEDESGSFSEDEEFSGSEEDETFHSNDEQGDKSFERNDNNDSKTPEVWEDIYGRCRDKEGNVIKNTDIQKYIPPSLRKMPTSTSAAKQEELLKVKRILKGLLNRLSESNLQPIFNQVEQIYMKNGRNDINETLFTLMCDLVLTPIQTASRLLMEQAMLIALLHANVGAEIGAFFLHRLVMKLDSLFKTENYGEGKICNNVLIFLSHLYNFKVAHSTLIFDIFRKLIDSFQSKDIELIQLFLKNIGFVLRKDDPVSLKEIIMAIQAKASTLKKEEADSRITFMLETLTAIRNNNMYKIPDYDPSIIEHSKKVVKAYVRKGCSMQELAVSYEDLIKADERGRWWIVGSAWSDRENPSTSVSDDNPKKSHLPKSKYSEKLLELAQKQHMNTDVRKSIFCIIMTAEDYIDAFQKLLKLNLKNQQEQEIINVILHCVLEEKIYNPFYAYLAGKFCTFARKFQGLYGNLAKYESQVRVTLAVYCQVGDKLGIIRTRDATNIRLWPNIKSIIWPWPNNTMSLQFCLWDKFKELSKMKPHQVRNLAKFLSHCFTSLTLPLSVLKVIHLSEMDKIMLKFMRQILVAVLLHESEETCVQVFKRISYGKNLNLLRESLKLFMHHFVLKNTEKYTSEDAEKLPERVKVAEMAMSSDKNVMKL